MITDYHRITNENSLEEIKKHKIIENVNYEKIS